MRDYAKIVQQQLGLSDQQWSALALAGKPGFEQALESLDEAQLAQLSPWLSVLERDDENPDPTD